MPDLLLMIETGPVSDQSGAVLGWGNDKGGFLMRGNITLTTGGCTRCGCYGELMGVATTTITVAMTIDHVAKETDVRCVTNWIPRGSSE